MPDGDSDAGFWKWIAGGMLALCVSNVATALVFRTNEDEIARIVKTTFTDISSERGMYVIEGRPRIAFLEGLAKDQSEDLREIRRLTQEMSTQLRKLDETQ